MAQGEQQRFQLSSQLIGHQDDVRGVCECGDSMIATASRDTTVRMWQRQGLSPKFELKKTFRGHESFVGPVAYIPPQDGLPDGGLVSGGMDKSIIVWSFQAERPLFICSGHELQVTSIAVASDGSIYSASLDSTVRRWSRDKQVEVLTGHTLPVQAVLILPDSVVATGSTDTTIKLWRGTRCIRTIAAHSDTVRGLALLPGVGFLSASHDGTVKLWSFDGDKLLEMVAHTSIVFSVAAHSSGLVASGSEDSTVRIWKDGVCTQTIEHPGCVWSAQFLPNGDLITACSDGIARVWSLDSSRHATADEVANYEAAVSVRKTQSQSKTVGNVKLSALPGLDALREPGATNGQTKVVREGDSAVAYSWNMHEYKWDKVGEVVDGPGQTGSYDYVFNVDIGDGQMRELGYNNGENPYSVAERWLNEHELSPTFRQQVADFIVQNTKQPIALDANFYDPYTGGSAYVPQTPNSSGYKLKHTPKLDVVSFDAAKYDGMARKLSEFNGSQGSFALSPEEFERLNSVILKLKDTSHYHVSQFSEADLGLFSQKLFHWALPNIFPVLDLLKMVILHPHAANCFSMNADVVILGFVKRALQEPVLPNNAFLGARVIVNCFKQSCFKSWLHSRRSEILDMLSDHKHSDNKNTRAAYCHLISNYAVRLIEAKDQEGQCQVLSAALEVAEHEEDSEIKYVALQTISTLVHSGLVKRMVLDLDISNLVADAKRSTVTQVSEVGSDLEFLLK